MPTNLRWIDTDRQTDAEILSEIAGCDTVRMVLQRMPADPFDASLVSAEKSNGVTLWAVPATESCLVATNGWPDELSLLVTPPAEFILIADDGPIPSRTSAARRVTSLWDWLLLRQAEGEAVHRILLEQPSDFRLPLRDPVRHTLLPSAGPPLSELRRQRIVQLGGIEFVPGNPDVMALRAGLFQWHDALGESHECAQAIEGKGRQRAGDYWHAILHRREPDYGNAKYWFRRVGPHSIFPELGRRAEPGISQLTPEWKARLLKNGWDPCAFVDFCETAASQKDVRATELAKAIQATEMLLLLASTYQDAIS